jgi:hypothetical protein
VAVYGDMLSVFPELVRTYQVFTMGARIGGGYGPRKDEAEVSGIFQWVSGGRMGIVSGNREENDAAAFYVAAGDAAKARQGMYLEVPGEGIFLFNHDDNFEYEGGFVAFDLQLVKGPTDGQYRNPKVDLGVRDYA